jgi:hypothetical protein
VAVMVLVSFAVDQSRGLWVPAASGAARLNPWGLGGEDSGRPVAVPVPYPGFWARSRWDWVHPLEREKRSWLTESR